MAGSKAAANCAGMVAVPRAATRTRRDARSGRARKPFDHREQIGDALRDERFAENE